MNHTPVHFEIPADDPEKLSAFYTGLFGWKIEKWPGGNMDYWMIQAAPEGEGVNGGMMKRQAPQQPITIYFSVESINDFSKKVTDLGGQVIMPKTPVPAMGWFAVCLDPQKNVFAIWEMDESAA
jgi:uncharacterized protein